MRRILAWVLAAVCMFSFACAETVTGNLEERFGKTPVMEYQGQTFRLRNRLTTILLAGTDRRMEDTVAANEYRNGGQADFLLLLVIDDNRDTIQPVHINRDTMAEITVLSVLGQETGTRTAQLCLAHGFGDGAEQSCELLVRAVSKRLLDVPVDHYAVMNLDGIAALNDAIGGVEVTLQEDFTAYDPQMTAGKTLRLKGSQAEIYVRQRYYVGEQTNTARMSRQQTYMRAAAKAVESRVRTDAGFITALFSLVEPYLVTDMGRGRIANLSNSAEQYELLPMLELEGEAVLGESGFMEFYPTEASVTETVLEAFFEPRE